MLLISFFASCKDNRTDYQKANDFFKEKKYEKAVLYFKNSMKNGLKTSILHKKLADSYIKLNRLSQAENSLLEAVKLSPNDDELMYEYIEVMYKRKKYSNSLFRLKSMPESYQKNILLSQINLDLRRTKTSFDHLDKAISYIEGDDEKLKLRYEFAKKILNYKKKCIEKNKLFAGLYTKLKDDISFLELYYKALSCTYPDKVQDRQVIRLYDVDKLKRASTKFEVLNKIIKELPTKYYFNELTQIYINKQKFREAKQMLRESEKIEKKQNRVLYLKAQINYKLGRKDLALEQVREVFNRTKDIKALRLLAEIEYRVENNFSAIKHYKEVIKLDEYDKDSLYILEELYNRVGDKKSATEMKYKIKFFYRKFYK